MKKVQPQAIAPYTPVNWCTPQWVVNIIEPTFIILTTGKHDGALFEGAALPCEDWPNGSIATNWHKECFEVLKHDVRFVISNED